MKIPKTSVFKAHINFGIFELKYLLDICSLRNFQINAKIVKYYDFYAFFQNME